MLLEQAEPVTPILRVADLCEHSGELVEINA